MTTPGAAEPNLLLRERSPYLLQHAYNPVRWWPWCDEAFAAAEAEDKPVFLSIGYSACHWCHVMERESFADPAVAELLSRHFIAVKVDREERPDLDHTYQLAYQLIAGRGGGWPLSMFLTPARAPFFGGTYFPDRPRHGLPAFTDVLRRVAGVWSGRRDEVHAQAAELRDALRDAGAVTASPADPAPGWIAEAAHEALRRSDIEHGGFGLAPKFPNATAHEMLLVAGLTDASLAAPCVDAVTRALDAMSRGGIRDHLGGGYARYSTDREWRVPHFEKMLYDNALLLRLFTSAWRALSTSARPWLDPARCAREVDDIARWIAREMTSPEGMFFSAQDADSEGEEGRFFVWTPDELRALLGEDDARVVAAWFDVTDAGTFERGRSVLRTPRDAESAARALDLGVDRLRDVVARATAAMLDAREKRPRVLTDDKCLASWNGLLIGALADAGATLERGELVRAAERAMSAWLELAWRDGALAHAARHGVAYGDGLLVDYAAMTGAAMDLWEATFNPRWLVAARALCEALLDRFHDAPTGALFFTPAGAEAALGRREDTVDAAHPSGVGMALDALLRLAVVTGHERFERAALQGVRRYAGQARGRALGMSSTILAADRAARGSVEVIVIGGAPEAMLRAARAVPVAHRVLLWARDEARGVAAGIAPSLLAHRAAGPGDAAVAYVCRGDACEMPSRSPVALRDTLLRLSSG